MGEMDLGHPRDQICWRSPLIDGAEVDVRPPPFRLGGFLNDYEGIGDNGPRSPRLGDMCFLQRAERLEMVPLQIRRFSLNRASPGDVHGMKGVFANEGSRLRIRVKMQVDGSLIRLVSTRN